MKSTDPPKNIFVIIFSQTVSGFQFDRFRQCTLTTLTMVTPRKKSKLLNRFFVCVAGVSGVEVITVLINNWP